MKALTPFSPRHIHRFSALIQGDPATLAVARPTNRQESQTRGDRPELADIRGDYRIQRPLAIYSRL